MMDPFERAKHVAKMATLGALTKQEVEQEIIVLMNEYAMDILAAERDGTLVTLTPEQVCVYCDNKATHFGEGEPVCVTHIYPAAREEYSLIEKA